MTTSTSGERILSLSLASTPGLFPAEALADDCGSATKRAAARPEKKAGLARPKKAAAAAEPAVRGEEEEEASSPGEQEKLAIKVKRMLRRRQKANKKKKATAGAEDATSDDEKRPTLLTVGQILRRRSTRGTRGTPKKADVPLLRLDADDSVLDLRPDDDDDDERLESPAEAATATLLSIVNAEKQHKKAAADSPEGHGEEDEEAAAAGLFQRGMISVRNSLRRIRDFRRAKAGSEDAAGMQKKAAEQAKGLAAPKGECNESQDSGLGEDSDYFDPTLSTASPRSPTPGHATLLTSSSSSSCQSGLLRPGSSRKDSKDSATAVAFASALAAKKHVLIREPSLIHLPSGQRRLQAEALSSPHRRLETVTIYAQPARVPLVAERTRSVSAQWDHMYQAARTEVLRHVSGCDPLSVRIVFTASIRDVRGQLEQLEDTAPLIHTLYRILFFEWIKRDRTGHLAIVLHCIQNLLIVVVEVSGVDCPNRLRLHKACRDLKRSCEAMRYCPLGACLDHTRRVYIDLWCTLLCLPFTEIERAAKIKPGAGAHHHHHQQQRLVPEVM